ncbi:hypothetical protein [Chromobacterium alticapitis]|uniref:Uncharacterized protein n=1 Tax=Chromobacterium alticapitis TaxID=2073169 RepID=A0A2S5DBW8_9NEIS|nr:hypothetical protein [Chromobacterium alticapitis]POZ60563.1 hypothetical protein C2I19_18250 [Chromobacterium alticapitis]
MQAFVVPVLVAAFFADYLDAFGPLGPLLKLGMALTFLLVYLPSSLRLQRGSMGAAWLAAFCILYGLSRFSTLPSSMYELFKLSLPLVLVLGCINATYFRSIPVAPIALETRLRQALSIAMAINGALVLIQVALGNGPLSLLGVPADYFDSPEKAGRYSGLILNLPLWSAMLFTRLLLADARLFPLDAWQTSTLKKALLYFLLILSGQKYVILCAILYLLARATRGVRISLLALLIVCVPLLGSSQNSQIADRVKQSQLIMDVGVPALIAEADADAEYPQFRFLDLRVNSWLYAWANIQAHPFGRGIGTWGDFSASLNKTLAMPVTLSETQWGHLIVEQGIGALALIFFFSTPFLFAHSVMYANLRWLGFLVFAAGWFTMGSSDYLWFFCTYVLLFNLRGLQRLRSRQQAETIGAHLDE